MEMSSMANSWVDSYLEALLSAGLSTEHVKKASEEKEVAPRDADANIAAKYYVNQILNMDEESIQQAWMKVSHKSSVRLTGERDARLQYLSWRVWGMKRKHALVLQQRAEEAELDDSEEARSDTRSEGGAAGAALVPTDEEVAKLVAAGPTPSLPRLAVKPPGGAAAGDAETEDSDERDNLFSPEAPASPSYATEAMQVSIGGERSPKLYCVLISMHGLVRGDAMELGKDPDTGGQVKYVVELAKALSRHPAVHRVDLLTRLVRDPKVAPSYGQLEEPLTERVGELGGAYIARVPCGPVNTYLRKEQLWPYIREFADNALTYVCNTMAKLSAAGEPCELYDIHGHYADAGEAAALMSYTLGVEMVLTGHSLGRNKLDHLLKSGTMSRADIEASYAISRRIEGEERALDAALLVFTSTQQEVRDQWGLYDGYNADLERVVRQRVRRGRHFPIMRVIPPGLDFSNLKIAAPPDQWDPAAELAPAGASGGGALTGGSPVAARGASTGGGAAGGLGSPRGAAAAAAAAAAAGASGSPRTPATPASGAFDAFTRPAVLEDPPIWRSIFKFLRNPRKPVILAMSRPDAKKNITTLVKAYGKNGALREIANLVLVMGNREVIDGMAPGSAKVMEQVLKLIDAYDLYGSVAYPKRHTQDDISDIYLLPAATRGVFVNIALQEPFGLTLIEAAAHGVPIVATTNGGPVDIVHTLGNGILVEPTREDKVAEALLELLTNGSTWDKYAASGVANINAYSWSSHCIKCLNAVELEKLNSAKRTKQAQLRSNFSASLDDFNFNTISGSFTSTRGSPGASAHLDLLSPRSSTAVVSQGFAADDIGIGASSEPHGHAPLSINAPSAFAAASAGGAGGGSPHASTPGAADLVAASPRARGSERGLASTSVPLTGAYGGGAELAGGPAALPAAGAAAAAADAAQAMGMVRDKYVVFTLDSSDTVGRLSKLLARKGKALMGLAAAGHSVGLGVATAFSLSDTADLLKSAGMAMSDLDFAITSSGSEVWYCGAARGASAGGGGADAAPPLDEAYDALLDANWDLISVRRVLSQSLAAMLRQLPAGGAAAAGAAAAARVAAAGGGRRQSLSLPLPRYRIQQGGTHQLVVSFGEPDAADTAAPPPLRATELASLIARIKRRLRRSGLRTNVTAQLDGGAVKLHITPARGSRALALRHLTYRHKVDMTSLVLVTCARDLAPAGDGGAGVAKFACSDMDDVVAGVQGVLVVPPAPAGAEPLPAAADGFPVDLSLYTHDGRVQQLLLK